jgi:pSer/pThr/pTyr-binding forkhead associated (FHA) protein
MPSWARCSGCCYEKVAHPPRHTQWPLCSGWTPIQSPGARYSLSANAPTWIGRDPNCAVCVNSEFASARHARVEWHADQRAWWVKDNDSRNGTTVNGERIMRSELANGDIIAIAGAQFRLTIDD